MKIKIFNREICVCALLATNSLIHFMDLAISWLCATKQRRNGVKNESEKMDPHCVDLFGDIYSNYIVEQRFVSL